MKFLFEDDSWIASINWSKPVEYLKVKKFGSRYDGSPKLYKITGQYLNNPPKLLYVGKTYKQSVSRRLNQQDHIKRYDEIKDEHPKHKILISLGNIIVENGILNSKRVDEIESILIYTHDSDFIFNDKKLNYLPMKEQYVVRNTGYSAPFYKEIKFGITVKE